MSDKITHLSLECPTSIRFNPNIANIPLATNRTLLHACWSVSHTETTCKCCPAFVSSGRHCSTWSEQQGTQFALRISSATTAVARSMSQWTKLQPIYMQNTKLFPLKTYESAWLLRAQKDSVSYLEYNAGTLARSFVCSLAKPLRATKLHTSQPHQFHSHHIQFHDSLPTYDAFLHIKIILRPTIPLELSCRTWTSYHGYSPYKYWTIWGLKITSRDIYIHIYTHA